MRNDSFPKSLVSIQSKLIFSLSFQIATTKARQNEINIKTLVFNKNYQSIEVYNSKDGIYTTEYSDIGQLYHITFTCRISPNSSKI